MISASSSVLKNIFKSCVAYVEILLKQRMYAPIFMIFISKILWALLTIIIFSVKRKNVLKWMMLFWLTIWRKTSIISLSLSSFFDRLQKINDSLFFINMFKSSLKQIKSYNNSSIINFISLQLLILHQLSLKLSPL